MPQRYPNYYWDFRFPTFISVYHVDGSVNVSHAGIEMGQGINTKVCDSFNDLKILGFVFILHVIF